MNEVIKIIKDLSLSPNYHYRDDAKLLWEAIEKYVTRIVNHFYGMYVHV